jgi:hypothetical protein
MRMTQQADLRPWQFHCQVPRLRTPGNSMSNNSLHWANSIPLYRKMLELKSIPYLVKLMSQCFLWIIDGQDQ